MSKRLFATFCLAISLLFSAPALMADNGHGNGNGQGNGNGHGNGNGNGHGNKHHDNDQGWEKKDKYEYRTYAVSGPHPPGWSQGKKTGWGNCGMPPGQAKKYGCRTYTYEGRPYYYYQNEGGQIIVRRPIISIQGGVTIAP
jgi:hypothetical protein